jgi:hypothetical protein
MKGSNKTRKILQKSLLSKQAIEQRDKEATPYVISKTNGSTKSNEELIGDGKRIF